MYNSNLLIQSMIDHIYETNDEFPFSKINISKPVALTGGSHLIKFSLNSIPLYVNPPKCNVKVNAVRPAEESEQVKKAKRTHCDFIFSQEHDSFLRWIENLEEFSQKKIFENRSQWFESTLEQEDIENSFTSPLKVIKSGKQYLLRVSIPQTKPGDRNGFKIFNENEQELSFEEIDESRQILCVLEIRGIRFSSKSFQIEIDVKQMMALNPVDLFDRCVLLKRPANTSVPVPVSVNVPIADSLHLSQEASCVEEPILKTQTETIIEKNDEEKQTEEHVEQREVEQSEMEEQEEKQEEQKELEPKNRIDGLDEIELDLDNMSTEDTITLKQRNDVYYEMYMEARRKAKIARDLALSAYLEARRIKNTYMLNDIIDSDNEDESDMEELEELEELEEKEDE